MKAASALVVSVLLFAAPSFAQEPMQPSRVAQAMMSDDLKDFFETAASADLLEIQSGQLAAQSATDPALKAFGQHMVTDHTRSSTGLKALAGQKGVSLPTALLGRHQSMLDRLRDKKPGKDFDKTFRTLMVASHKEAVSLYDKTAKDAKDPDVQAFAARMLPKLQQHGAEAKALPEAK